MKWIFLKTIVFLFVLTSCSDETIPPNELIGRWNWISSSGGIAGSTYTPEITGETIILQFTSDSVYKQYRNDTLLIDCQFSIIQAESIYDHEITNMIECDGYLRRSFSFNAQGNLILADEAFDGFISQYERIE
ncbi:hypothetical protein [uncultured Draconibacterium sp.]|uniref:hypothetical protein n=1 Tax=uncultured Draconibacterium sp. TaxID=1573823 RepID=UPI002AA6778E|nr:hypothetical protein [uncultured Draconibacterium sp.]